MSLKTTCPEGLAPSAAEFKGGALECDWIRDLTFLDGFIA